jgi:hypothetical protein
MLVAVCPRCSSGGGNVQVGASSKGDNDPELVLILKPYHPSIFRLALSMHILFPYVVPQASLCNAGPKVARCSSDSHQRIYYFRVIE